MVLTSKWGRILQEMTHLINVCAQCGQTGRNKDKIPCYTSKVNYVPIAYGASLCTVSESQKL